MRSTTLEAHGTGTAVGDPIEARAIGEALGQYRKTPLLIGSVKSNLGHLETASGVAGLAKALYSIQHREVPATIGIRKLNPRIKFDEWNLSVVTKGQALKKQGRLVIGINSFGFGGANAHVILESPHLSELSQRHKHPAHDYPFALARVAKPRSHKAPMRWPAICAKTALRRCTISPIRCLTAATSIAMAPCFLLRRQKKRLSL